MRVVVGWASGRGCRASRSVRARPSSRPVIVPRPRRREPVAENDRDALQRPPHRLAVVDEATPQHLAELVGRGQGEPLFPCRFSVSREWPNMPPKYKHAPRSASICVPTWDATGWKGTCKGNPPPGLAPIGRSRDLAGSPGRHAQVYRAGLRASPPSIWSSVTCGAQVIRDGRASGPARTTHAAPRQEHRHAQPTARARATAAAWQAHPPRVGRHGGTSLNAGRPCSSTHPRLRAIVVLNLEPRELPTTSWTPNESSRPSASTTTAGSPWTLDAPRADRQAIRPLRLRRLAALRSTFAVNDDSAASARSNAVFK